MFIAFLAALVLVVASWQVYVHGYAQNIGVMLPLVAFAVFVCGFIWRILKWAKSPVPFSIPTTAGQQRSLSWIKPARLDSPFTKVGTVGRMLLEVLCFRSLFRNTRSEIVDGQRMVHYSAKWLWLFSLVFHYCFLIIFIRHFRYLLDPVPLCIQAVEALDGIMQIGATRFYITDALIVVALFFLLGRRLYDTRLRYISLANDYFPLFLLFAVVITGISMRYITTVDVDSVRQITLGMTMLNVSNAPTLPLPFFLHIMCVSALLLYFPFSKLMHMGGVFLSPTRNLPNNTRAVMHVNPWNPPKYYRTYEEYEDDFREAMEEAGLPVDKPSEQAASAE